MRPLKRAGNLNSSLKIFTFNREMSPGMANKLELKVLWIILLSLLLLATGVVSGQESSAQSGRLGDFHDGSGAHSVHHITLYAEDGFQIFPGVNDDQPFSTYATCIRCHAVETIEKNRLKYPRNSRRGSYSLA